MVSICDDFIGLYKEQRTGSYFYRFMHLESLIYYLKLEIKYILLTNMRECDAFVGKIRKENGAFSVKLVGLSTNFDC